MTRFAAILAWAGCLLTAACVNAADQTRPPEPGPVPATENDQELVVITGRIIIYGNEPFTYAGIETEEGTVYRVDKSLKFEMSEIQNEWYQFRGRFREGGIFYPVSWKKK